MVKLTGIVLIAIFLLAVMPGEACAKSVRAYYNGQEATVTGIVLRPGDTFTVDLYITPDAESDAYAEVNEPGVTRAYDRIEGDPIRPTVVKRCNASSPAHYRWVIAANKNWPDGTAPLNIYYQWGPVGQNSLTASGLFTVMEAYIVPGENAANATDKTPAGTPATDVLAVIFCIAGAVTFAKVRPGRR